MQFIADSIVRYVQIVLKVSKSKLITLNIFLNATS